MSLPNKITAILVDDEPKAIHNLYFLLGAHCPDVSVAATCNSVDEAVIEIEKHKPDVVFLDIEMPEKSGFELFENTNQTFQTIFVTAYDEYALQAFEVSAIDYLLKPIEITRLKKAVAKLNGENNQSKITVLQQNINASEITQIVIPYKDTQLIVKVNDIICFEANASYCYIHCQVNGQLKSYMYSKSLRYFYELLSSNTSFYRTHRSWFININKVASFSKKDNTISLQHNIEALLSKTKIKEFQTLL